MVEVHYLDEMVELDQMEFAPIYLSLWQMELVLVDTRVVGGTKNTDELTVLNYYVRYVGNMSVTWLRDTTILLNFGDTSNVA